MHYSINTIKKTLHTIKNGNFLMIMLPIRTFPVISFFSCPVKLQDVFVIDKPLQH